MSYVNLTPAMTFPKLERVIRRQRYIMMFDGAVTFLFMGGLLTALVSLL